MTAVLLDSVYLGYAKYKHPIELSAAEKFQKQFSLSELYATLRLFQMKSRFYLERCELRNYQMFAAVLIELALPEPVELTVGAKMGTGVTCLYPWDMPR